MLAVALGTILLLLLLPTLALAADANAGAPDSQVTVVRPLPELASMTSDTYLLSDGSRQAVIYSQPIRFRDAAGAWQSFDTTLVSGKSPGAYTAVRTPVVLTIGTLGSGAQGAELVADGYTVVLSLLDAGGSALGTPVALPVSGSKASYAGIAPATDISYTSLNWGVEQTLALNSAAAPTTFRTQVSHPGLVLARDDLGQWGLYVPGKPYPLFLLSDMSVVDSSGAAGALPAICYGAAMTVKPGKDQSTLTYTVPAAWLSDPARVYPVIIDPTLTKNPDPGNAGYPDTCVSSQGSGSHGTAPNLLTGKHTDGYFWRSLLKFDTTSIPSSAYVEAATLSVRKYDQGASTANAYLRPMWTNWSGGNTWNDLAFSVDSYPVGWTDYTSATAPAWLDFNARSIVQGWMDGSIANYGFEINQKEDGSQGSAYASWYRSADHSDSSYWPKLVVTYDPSPSTAVSSGQALYSLGDTATVTARVGTYYPAEVRKIEVGLNYVNGPQRGLMGWFGDLATVPAGWTHGSAQPNGSYFAYDPNAAGASTITVNFASCSQATCAGSPGYKRATFAFAINQSFGNQARVTPDTFYAMGPGSADTYTRGFTVQQGGAFMVTTTAVKTLTYVPQASDWFVGSPPNDSSDVGRGSATLLWPVATGATGYHIYAADGGGAYRQIGATLGGGATLWSSAATAFYPSDSEIAAGSWPGSNPLYRATTPADATLQQTLTPSGLAGAGLCLSDGSQLYVRRLKGTSGPTTWTKVSFAGTVTGTVGSAQTDAYSAFLLNNGGNALYNGYLTKSGSTYKVNGIYAATGAAAPAITFSEAPLLRNKGTNATSSTDQVQLASGLAADGTPHIYSLSFTVATNGDGSPKYDGYIVRDYDATGVKLGDHTFSLVTGTTSETKGVLVDSGFLYLVEWSGSTTRVTKISLSNWTIANQWTAVGAATYAGGCYDATNNAFWLGSTTQGRLYKYSGTAGGLDLRDSPNGLYQKISPSGAYAAWTAYDFKVVPFNASGEFAAPPGFQVAATLDNRSLPANDDPAHTTADLGSWDGHAVAAQLDTGSLTVQTTDLAIASWGPEASLARSYVSSNTSANRFAPGWRFSFERGLTLVDSGTTDYYDAEGIRHRFLKPGSSWLAPTGYFATLAPAGSNWTLTYTDGTVLTFDPVGTLMSEADRNGNSVTYAWNAGNLTITAANGQQIAVTCSGAHVSTATYTVTIGGQQVTRQINYSTVSPWQVTFFPTKPEQRTLTYGYDGSSRLTGITQELWPQTGQSASETFAYTSGAPSAIYFPDYNATSKPDARAKIDYNGSSATITHYGTVNGTANQPTSVETDTWDAKTDAQQSQTVTTSASAGSTTTTYAYSANGEQADALTNSNQGTTQALSATDTAGRTLADSDDGEVGQTTYAYTDANNPYLPTQETDPQQNLTNTTYDSHGNLTATWTRLNAGGDYSETTTSYDAYGRVTQTKELISGTVNPSTGAVTNGVWNQSDLSTFAANGQPQTTIHRAVVLSYGGASQDLTEYATYDNFGNLLTKTDTSGSRVTETDTYDLAGRLLTSADALSATTHHTYDTLGYDTESWTSASGTNVKANWKRDTYDAMGRILTETTLLSDSNGNPTTQSVLTNTWDGVGNQLTSDNNTVGGQPAKCLYDDRANVIESWTEGVVDYTDARAARSTYDAQNRLLTEIAPGNANATTYTYNLDGQQSTVTNPDGSWIAYGYDDFGNKTSETKPKHGYSGDHNKVAVTQYAYDYAKRLTSATEPNSFATTFTYDELGRQLSASGGAGPASTTTYNSLGWELRNVEADGVTVTKVYDAAGRLTSETKGSQNPTSYTYDECNRLRTQTDPDGRILEKIYDAFGNTNEEKHTAGGSLKKDILIVVDSLGRPTSATDQASGGSGLQHTWTYPENQEGGITETQRYDASATVSTTISRATRGVETSRQTTYAQGQSVTRTINSRDNADRVTQATFATNLVNSRSFDAAGRLVRQWGTGYAAGAQTTDAYTYDPDTGQKVTDNVQLSYGGTITGSYTYDANGRLDVATIGGVASDHGFDNAGNLTSIVSGSTTTSFIYDSANRLTEKDVNGVLNTKYKWNTTYGWRTSQGPTDANQPITFAYTATGRLASYADTTRSLTATYSYDAAGQRTRSVVTQGSTTATTDYKYDGITLLGFTATQGSASWRIDYLYDENRSLYGGVYRDPATSTAPIVFAAVTTSHGDVVELLDTNGNPFAGYRYDAWGNPTSTVTQSTSLINSTTASNIASRQVLRYEGYCYDAESGMYYCSARSYDPATRQFASKDPAKGDGEESQYQYCGGNPVGRVDLSGTVDSPITSSQTKYCEDTAGVLFYKITMIGKNYFKSASSTKWKHIKFYFTIKEWQKFQDEWIEDVRTHNNMEVLVQENSDDSTGCCWWWKSADNLVNFQWYTVDQDNLHGGTTSPGTTLPNVRTHKKNKDGTLYSRILWKWCPDIRFRPDPHYTKKSIKF